MPVPKPTAGQSKDEFVSVCMKEVSKNKDRTNEQNVAICLQAWRDRNKKALTLPLQFRAIEAERSIDPETRTLSFSFSSRQPVKKFWGTEVLSHAPGAVDTDRLKRGAVPFLLDHNREKLIGKVVGYELKDERMHATVRLSQSALASEVMQEMADGIRDNISVGYVPREAKLVSTSDKDGDTFLVTKWEVMEVSSVAIPADPTVGIGRDLGESETYECRVEPEPEGINPYQNVPLPEVKPAPPVFIEKKEEKSAMAEDVAQPTVEINFDEIRSAERARCSELIALGKRFGADEKADCYIREEKTVADFRAYLLDEKLREAQSTMVGPNPLGMNQKEIRAYSLLKALSQGADKLDGLEREASVGLAKFLGRQPQGFFVPDMALMPLQSRDLAAGIAGSGGVTIQLTVEPTLIAYLRNKMALGRAGATMMGGLTSNISLPRQSGPGQAYWLAENAPVTAASQTFDQVGLSPKRLAAMTNYSKQLLAQSSLDIENIVREDLLTIIALAQDAAGFYGTGVSNNQPSGLLSFTANTATTFNYTQRAPDVTFGAAATWKSAVTFEGNVENCNVDLDDTTAYITSPLVKATWKTAPKAVNYPVYLWENGDIVNGYKAIATKQIQNNIVVFGKWRDCIIGTWSGLDMVTDPYSLAHQNQVRVIVNLLTDIAFRYVLAFCASTDAGNQ